MDARLITNMDEDMEKWVNDIKPSDLVPLINEENLTTFLEILTTDHIFEEVTSKESQEPTHEEIEDIINYFSAEPTHEEEDMNTSKDQIEDELLEWAASQYFLQ